MKFILVQNTVYISFFHVFKGNFRYKEAKRFGFLKDSTDSKPHQKCKTEVNLIENIFALYLK